MCFGIDPAEDFPLLVEKKPTGESATKEHQNATEVSPHKWVFEVFFQLLFVYLTGKPPHFPFELKNYNSEDCAGNGRTNLSSALNLVKRVIRKVIFEKLTLS